MLYLLFFISLYYRDSANNLDCAIRYLVICQVRCVYLSFFISLYYRVAANNLDCAIRYLAICQVRCVCLLFFILSSSRLPPITLSVASAASSFGEKIIMFPKTYWIYA